MADEFNDVAILLSPQECVDFYWKFKQMARVATGIIPLDRVMGGGPPIGQVVGIVGGTGVRKSELLRHFRRHMVANDVGVVTIDVELGYSQLIEREICQSARIAPRHLRENALELQARAASARWVANHQQHHLIQLKTIPTRKQLEKALVDIMAKLRQANPQVKSWVVMFDSVQRLSPGFSNSLGDVRVGVQNFMYWADLISRTLNVAVIVTSERSRPLKKDDLAKNKEDLIKAVNAGAESRAIEYASHALLVLYPVYEDTQPIAGADDEEVENPVRVMLAKNRSGQEGWVPMTLYFQRPYWGLRVEDWGNAVPTKRPGSPKDPRARDVATDIENTMTLLGDCKRHTIAELRKHVGVNHYSMKSLLIELATAGHIIEERTPHGVSIGWRRLTELEKAAEKEAIKQNYETLTATEDDGEGESDDPE